MQNNRYNSNNEINECTSRGSCSTSPTIASLQELSLKFLKQLAHYTLRLELLGANNKSIEHKIITYLASLVSINEFSENQLYTIINNEYLLLEDTKKTYIELCNIKNLSPKILANIENYSKTTKLSSAIAIGEKIFLKNQKTYNKELYNLIKILLIILKSLSINLLKLSDFTEFDNKTYHKILKALTILNSKNLSTNRMTKIINSLSLTNKNLEIILCKSMIRIFDNIEKTEVSHSTSKGKAILVSGNNFIDLLDLLEKTKDKNIDIYTHSNLLISHSFKKFKSYKHLKGHYGSRHQNCILDFATFPGAILLTKNSQNNSEYFYRGRLFSSDYITPAGVIKIENNNYDQLIDSAINSKGFKKGKNKPKTTIGFNPDELNKEFVDISNKLQTNSIKKLYIIGCSNHQEIQHEYFNTFLSKISKKDYIINFGKTIDSTNVLNIDIGNFEPLFIYTINSLFNICSITNNKIIFLFSTCDLTSLSNIIAIKKLGAKNIYLRPCAPTTINPSTYENLCKNFEIKILSNITEDLNNKRK